MSKNFPDVEMIPCGDDFCASCFREDYECDHLCRCCRHCDSYGCVCEERDYSDGDRGMGEEFEDSWEEQQEPL